ncbi:hypothetical protein ACX1C1_08775 [Paenibacillus sp. strain BS8-2]
MMLELELHDWLPYLFSISLLCTIAYSYTIHLRESNAEYASRVSRTQLWLMVLPQLTSFVMAVGLWLIRYVKRKSAPDDDDSACRSSLEKQQLNQRGGYICLIQQHQRLHSCPVPRHFGLFA